MRAFYTLWTLCILALFAGCESKPKPDLSADGGAAPAPNASASAAVPAADKPLELVIAYGSEKKTWFEEEAKAFEATRPKTTSGRPIKIVAKAMGSGEAMNAIVSGAVKPAVFSPASQAYVSLLNNAYAAKTGRAKALAPPGEVIVLSPVVIAMWKPMAEALGWPTKPIGWADLLKVSADPKGWGGKGFPEWGRFKLGHTHPEFSNSGFLAVLAEAYAGAKKTRGLGVADLDAPATRKLLESIEGTVVHYGKSTGFFAEKMLQRGPQYISAAVLYENLVIESYASKTPPPQPLVAVYPKEGTFWSDHPYSILDAEWVGPEQRQAAEAFLAFLKAKPQQQRALELGFRPGDASVAITSPIDAAHGVDAKQPQTLLEVPDAAVMEKLLSVWRDVKKGADVVFVFDKSGSMRGKPLDEAKRGAKSFFDNLTDGDEATLMFFDGKVYPAFGPLKLGGGGRAQLQQRLDGVTADGGTALYEAVGTAYGLLRERAAKNPMRTHAIVVMTDGNDENSKLTLPELKKQFPADESLIKVFTIAYGTDANPKALDEIAEAAKGSSVKGSVDTINQVYADMAAFF